MSVSRRDFVQAAAALAATGVVARDARAATDNEPARRDSGEDARDRAPFAGRTRQSASRWCYQSIPLPALCDAGKAMGLAGIDLLQQSDWDLVRDKGLVVTMGYAADRRDFLRNGFTNRASHAMLLKELEMALPVARAKGVPNLIAMFGNRDGRSDADAIAAAIEGLRKIAPLAEEAGVTICVELLNSRIDHKDYHGDRTDFGVEVMNGVNSPRVKLLYDIYHMQIMEGDVIRTIQRQARHIGHVHTGGVPGRHEIDDTQELNWRAVVRALADSGYAGYVAHEFIPTRDPLTSLREAVRICDV
ncbi:MAG: TIM barrel protein [Gemmatimonadetes bacterium]|nr:TIM barrel protein [Gemmatimonadota bacterium]